MSSSSAGAHLAVTSGQLFWKVLVIMCVIFICTVEATWIPIFTCFWFCKDRVAERLIYFAGLCDARSVDSFCVYFGWATNLFYCCINKCERNNLVLYLLPISFIYWRSELANIMLNICCYSGIWFWDVLWPSLPSPPLYGTTADIFFLVVVLRRASPVVSQ